jgi:hypothetical protein
MENSMRRSLGVGVSVLATAVLGAGLAVGALASDTPPAASVDLGTGSAWFGTRRGSAVLIDGATGNSIQQVRGALRSEQVDVEQDGASALVVDRAAGTVARIDGATWAVDEPRTVSSPNDPGLKVHLGGGTAWAIGQSTTVVQQLDPQTLAVIGEPQTVPSRVSGAAVSRDGTLWVTSPDGEVRSYRDGRSVATHRVGGMRQAALVMAGDDPVLVDPGAHIARRLDPASGEDLGELCFDAPAGSEPLVSGTTSARRWLLSVVPTAGTLLVIDTRRGSECRAFGLGEPAARPRYGDPVEKDGRVFVPDHVSGQVVVVDPDAPVPHAQKIKRLDLQLPNVKLRVLARGNRIWWENPDGDEVGVITDDLKIRRGDKGDKKGNTDDPGNPGDGTGEGRSSKRRGGQGQPGSGGDGAGGSGSKPRPPGATPQTSTPPRGTMPPAPPADSSPPPPPKGSDPISVAEPIPSADQPPPSSVPPPGEPQPKPTTVDKPGASTVTTRPGQTTTTRRPTSSLLGTTTTRPATTTTSTRPATTTTTTTRPPLAADFEIIRVGNGHTIDDEIELRDITPGGTSRAWNIPGSNTVTSNAAVVRVKYAGDDTHSITLTVSDGSRMDTETKTVQVLPRNASSVLGRSTSPPENVTLNFGDTVNARFEVAIGATIGGRIEVEVASGAGRAPGVAPLVSGHLPAGTHQWNTSFTVPRSSNPVLVDGFRVRIVLDDGTPLDARSFPTHFYFVDQILGPETCRSYNPNAVALRGDDIMAHLDFGNGFTLGQLIYGREAQELILALARANNQYCSVGANMGSGPGDMSYWKGPRPMPALPQENCRSYDPQALRPEHLGEGYWWELTDGRVRFVAGTTADEAQRALSVARRSNQYCEVPPGDIAGPVEYFR